MTETFEYDVFLGHSAKDKAVVRELARRLKKDGVRVWFDEWEIRPGDMIGKRIEQGLEASRVLVLAMSKHAFESEWATLESGTFRFRDPTNKERRFIPLRLDDAEITDTLKQFAYVDWRGKSDQQYAKLLTACRQEPVSEQPTTAPPVSRVISLAHTGYVWSAAITPDGKRAVSGSDDKTVRVWDLEKGNRLATLKGHTQLVYSVAITGDGKRAVSGSDDHTVRIWDVEEGKEVAVLKGHTGDVNSVAITGDGKRAVSGSDDHTVRIWDLEKGKEIAILKGHTGEVYSVAITADGKRAISGSYDKTVRVWDLEKTEELATLEGHASIVWGVAITGNGKRAVSGSFGGTVRVWDLEKTREVATLEGHTGCVNCVAVTGDGKRAVTGSDDQTVRVWNLEQPKAVGKVEGHSRVYGVAITNDGRCFSADDNGELRIWSDVLDLAPDARVSDAASYTNAKVLLVGESGVGKTGLMYRLTEDCFKDSVSTDAAWATQLPLPQAAGAGGMEREIWLWDFAGQADYRLIHQLYMDETSLAVLVFNPQSENPFEGLGQWDRDLQRAARRAFRKLLVAGRCDRGGLMISRDSVEAFRAERGFAEYIETSARLGTGCDRLREAIIEQIAWEDIPWTSSPRIFKLLKDEIIRLKDEGKVLLRMVELKQQLELRMPDESFTMEQLRAVVGLLAGPGVVWQLEFGDFVLLQPERINAYAAAVIRSVRAHTEEIGCIAEEDVLAGKLDYQDMKRLPYDEEQIVLRAMHQTFVDHGLCLREHTEQGTLLIFPSYFKRERPALKGHPLVLVTYQFNGALDEIYATLIVRLHHTAAFERDQLWRFAADYKAPAGKRLGLKMVKKAEGAAELEVYFEPGISNEVQVTFIRYVHEHLKLKGQEVW
ncbi:MAG: TIR domain-containing protein [Planctomycetota bacterium]|jgi:small GTP-binding protein